MLRRANKTTEERILTLKVDKKIIALKIQLAIHVQEYSNGQYVHTLLSNGKTHFPANAQPLSSVPPRSSTHR